MKYIETEIAPCIKNVIGLSKRNPGGKTDAPDYLNQVVALRKGLAPQALFFENLDIENKTGPDAVKRGRVRSTIDIDILFFTDQQIINAPGLIIPHPELQKRRFTIEPLAEIAPDWMHPILKKNILQLKNELIDELNVKKI